MTSLTSLFDSGVKRRRGATATATRRLATRRDPRLTAATRGRGSTAATTAVLTDTRSSWRSTFPAYRARTLVREALIGALAGTMALLAGVEVAALVWVAALAAALPATSAALGAYRWRTLGEGPIERRAVAKAGLTIAGALVTVGYLGLVAVPPVVVLGAVPVAVGAAVVGRSLARRSLVTRRVEGTSRMRTMVVGAAGPAQQFIDQARSALASGYDVVGWCASDSLDDGDELDVPILGSTSAISAVVAEHEIDVVFLVGCADQTTARALSWSLTGTRAALVVVPSIAEISSSRVRVRPVADLWSVQLDVAPRRDRNIGKDVFDRLVGLVLLVAAGFVVVPAMLAVRLTSPGPALYKQSRIGVNGRPFTMWKVRSMFVDADARREALLAQSEGNGLLFKMRADPRITPVGKWLRRLSIDELPQLVNVVRGEMSIVGPRPALAEETALYTGDEMRRLIVKPGLTGLWQVSGRSDLSREESMRLDLRYVDNISASMDSGILSRTARAVLGGKGAY